MGRPVREVEIIKSWVHIEQHMHEGVQEINANFIADSKNIFNRERVFDEVQLSIEKLLNCKKVACAIMQ